MRIKTSLLLALSGFFLSLMVNLPMADSRTLPSVSPDPEESEEALDDYEEQLEDELFSRPSRPSIAPATRPVTIPPIRFRLPAQGVLTSGYGWRWGRMHRGIDIAGPVGTPIVASADGQVVFSGWNSGGYGYLVELRHRDGAVTRYAHNSRNLVSVGQVVKQGETISLMGSTGYSTGPHCHFEIILPGKGAVNPIALLPG